MPKINYNILIPKLQKKRPFPEHSYNFKSEKYGYVSNETLDGIDYWHGCLQQLIPYKLKCDCGFLGHLTWHYYSDSEERCAEEVYKMMKRYLRRVTREGKRHDNGHYRRHLNWQKWIANYESIHNEQ